MFTEEAKNQENLWNKILGEAVKKRESKDANILIVGDKGSGKRILA
jgi:DNA-binding NtrC family response regulator